MPAVTIYSVDFANGNLAPFLDQDNWESMVQGHSPAETLHSFSSYPVADEGLHLDLSRAGGTALPRAPTSYGTGPARGATCRIQRARPAAPARRHRHLSIAR